jgi:hypothetical protein
MDDVVLVEKLLAGLLAGAEVARCFADASWGDTCGERWVRWWLC